MFDNCSSIKIQLSEWVWRLILFGKQPWLISSTNVDWRLFISSSLIWLEDVWVILYFARKLNKSPAVMHYIRKIQRSYVYVTWKQTVICSLDKPETFFTLRLFFHSLCKLVKGLLSFCHLYEHLIESYVCCWSIMWLSFPLSHYVL